VITLLRNAELYDPAPLGRRNLVVAGGEVLWVGRDVPAIDHALDVDEVDLGGRRVIPGLIDGHVHLTGGGGEAGPETRVPPVPITRLTLGGVTTAVGVLGTDDAVRTTAELVTVARGIIAQGLSAWCHTGGYHVPPTTATGSVRLDIALIDLVIGVGELAISDHRSSQPTLDELLRVAGDAHVGGLMSGKAGIVHLHVGDGPRGLELIRQALDASELPPAMFQPTHVNRRRALFDEAMALTERGCTIDVTAFPVADGEDAWSADEAVVRYLDAGRDPARITVSSDGGGCLPVFDGEGRVASFDVGSPSASGETLGALLRRGQPLERVLPAFTTNPARVLLLHRKGRIGPGMDADMVVLGANGEVEDVMARGRWMVKKGIPVVWGTFEDTSRPSARPSARPPVRPS
jgi:beta-aspartyl-dipeptidase (metallo-type)